MKNKTAILKSGLTTFSKLTVIWLVASCVEVANQKPEYIWADRQAFPEEVDKVINPKPTSEQVDRILQNKFKYSKTRIPVAVVDNGTDYLHPQLIDKMNFRFTSTNEVSGVGLDVLGDDKWPSYHLFDDILYAFTAEEIASDGRLVNTPDDPLTFLVEIEKELISDILEKIKKTKKFNNTIFSQKITERSLSFIDLYELNKMEVTQINFEKIIDKTGKISKTDLNNTDKEYFENMANKPWHTSPSFEGWEGILKNLELGKDLFILMTTTYQAWAEKYKISERFSRLSNRFSEKIAENMFIRRYGNSTASPLVTFYEDYCNVMEYFLQQNEAKVMSDSQLLNKYHSTMKEYIQLWKTNLGDEPDFTDMTKLQNTEKYLNTSVADTLAVIEKNAVLADVLRCQANQAVFYTDQLDESNGHIAKTTHSPYINEESFSVSHGTHTAGIIAKQSKFLTIEPIRVATQSIFMPKAELTPRIIRLSKEMKAWLNLKPVQLKYAKELKSLLSNTDLSFDDAIDNLMNYSENASSNRLYMQFIQDIITSIEWIGTNQVKLVNMSLGTSFLKDVDSLIPTSDVEELNILLEELLGEFYKYTIAKTIVTSAPHTLFVVASGNDGTWLDGDTRSGLPCDLSSPKLQEFEDGKLLPNNSFQNILCVGSLSDKDKISSFSNLPLTNVPFVFAYGENVLSTVQTQTCEGNVQSFNTTYKGSGRTSLPYTGFEESDESKQFFKEQKLIEVDSNDTLPMIFGMNFKDAITEFIEVSTQFLINRDCYYHPKPFAQLSGTSMATPYVTGALARTLAVMAEAKGVKQADLYNHPDFTPESIIKHLPEWTEKYGGMSIIKDVPKLTNVKKWKQWQFVPVLKVD